MDGWMDELIDGWMDGWMDGYNIQAQSNLDRLFLYVSVCPSVITVSALTAYPLQLPQSITCLLESFFLSENYASMNWNTNFVPGQKYVIIRQKECLGPMTHCGPRELQRRTTSVLQVV